MTRTQRAALALFLLVYAIYDLPLAYDLLYKPFFNWSPGQDVVSTSLLPIAILERGDFTLNEFQEFITRNFHEPYFVATVNGKIVSRSPVAAAVIALSFYGIPLGTGWLAHSGREWLVYPETALMIAKFAAATLSALAALFFFFCARELADLKTSALLALTFAFGTSVWSTNSQGLWQQTPSVLFQLIGVYFLLRGRRMGAGAVPPGAFFFSFATISRANVAIAALLFTVYVLLEYRTAFVRWILWSIPPMIFFFAYNQIYNGSLFVFGYQDGLINYVHAPSLEAMLGLFISPSRGLLIYSPFLIFAVFGYRLARSEPPARFYFFCLLAFLLGVVLLSMWQNWDGGWGYGTRMLTDLLPYLTFLLIPFLKQMNSASRLAFGMMVGFAFILNSFALWDYGTRWHWSWDNYAYDVWSVSRNEPLFYLREYLAMAQHYLRWI